MKNLAFYLILIISLAACSLDSRTVDDKKILGPENEIRTIALVFKRFYGISELEKLLTGSGSSLIGLSFYSGTISASIRFESKDLKTQITEYKDYRNSIGPEQKKHIIDLIIREFAKISKKDFDASQDLQETAKYLLFDIKKAEEFSKASQEQKAMIYIVILKGKIADLNNLAQNSDYEGVVDFKALREKYGPEVKIIPRAKFIEDVYERDFSDSNFQMDSETIYQRIREIIAKYS